MRERDMKRPYQITGIVVVLFSAFMIYESLKLQFYTPIGPGPGFLPVWVSLLIGLFGGTIFYQATFKKAASMPADFFPTRAGFIRVGSVLIAAIATMLLMNPLGFRLTMFLFLMLLLMALDRRNLVWKVPIAILGSFGIYHAFTQWFDIPLPIGVLGI